MIPTFRPLPESELEVRHEKKLHLFVFDPALEEYRHVHPAYARGRWRVELDLPRDGFYWLWSQGVVTGEADESLREFLSSVRLRVQGGMPAHSLPKEQDWATEVLAGTDGNSRVSLNYAGTLHVGEMAMLELSYARTDGSQPAITPYLGAGAHVLAVAQSGSTPVHIHPQNPEGEGATRQVLHVHSGFPAAGSYRLWGQFRDAGQLRTVPLRVRVEERTTSVWEEWLGWLGIPSRG